MNNFKELKRRADQGDARAQYDLGILYVNGKTGVVDWELAISLFHKSAAQGYTDAYYELGYMYDNGAGTAEDRTKAVKWYKRAAKNGDEDAQYELELMHANKKGMNESNKHYNDELNTVLIAANSGTAESQINAGKLYAKGVSDNRLEDNAQAVEYFTLAAEQGSAEARSLLRSMNTTRNKYFDKVLDAAERGDVSAQFDIGELYAGGVSDNRLEDDIEAAQWFKLAAEQGLADAQIRLGEMYYSGHGVSRSKKAAVKWITLAAEQGDAHAQHRLNALKGDGRSPDRHR